MLGLRLPHLPVACTRAVALIGLTLSLLSLASCGAERLAGVRDDTKTPVASTPATQTKDSIILDTRTVLGDTGTYTVKAVAPGDSTHWTVTPRAGAAMLVMDSRFVHRVIGRPVVITGITPSGSGWTITTRVADITEVIQDAHVSFNIPLPLAPDPGVLSDGAPAVRASNSSVLNAVTVESNGFAFHSLSIPSAGFCATQGASTRCNSVSAQVDGFLGFATTAQCAADIHRLTDSYVACAAGVTLTGGLDFEASFTASGGGAWEHAWHTPSVGLVPIVGVPMLYATAELALATDLSADGKTSVKFGFDAGMHLSVNVTYNPLGGGFTSVFSANPTFTGHAPSVTLTAAANLRVGLKVRIRVSATPTWVEDIFDVGLGASADLFPYMRLAIEPANDFRSAQAVLTTGLDGEGDLYARVWKLSRDWGAFYTVAESPIKTWTLGNTTPPAPTLPDVTVTAATGQAVTVGSAMSVSAVLANIGAGAAGTMNVRFYLSTTTDLSGTTYILCTKAGVAGLAAGAQRTESASCPVPSNVPGGNYYLLAWGDADAQVTESNENNNIGTSSSRYAVTTPAPPSISSLSPASYPSSSNNQTMLISGTNFQNGATLSFVTPHGTKIASTATKLTFVGSGQISYQFNNGSDVGTWSVAVNNPDGRSSSPSTFVVK